MWNRGESRPVDRRLSRRSAGIFLRIDYQSIIAPERFRHKNEAGTTEIIPAGTDLLPASHRVIQSQEYPSLLPRFEQ
jgi:hypothetical protein